MPVHVPPRAALSISEKIKNKKKGVIRKMKNVKFDLPLLIPPRMADGVWTLGRPWRVDWGEVSFVLPRGFGTDGASIPRALWRVCGTPLDVPRLYAALVHDWLYSGDGPRGTRAEADAAYRDIQIALGVSRVKAWTEWAALRVCGGSHWCAHALIAAAVVSVLAGCATKTRNVEIDGLFTQAEAGIVAMGSVDVQASPVGEETALIKYEEDTAWLSPATKTHAIRIHLTGSNCVSCVTGVVASICGAFVEAKAAPSSAAPEAPAADAAPSAEKRTP